MAMLSLLQSGRRQQLHLNEMADLDSLVFGINSLHVDTRSESDDNINSDDEDSGSDAGTVLGIIICSSDAAATVSSFMASSGTFSLSTTASLHEQKLALWQSLLVGFHLCAPTGTEGDGDGSAAADSFWAGRPEHYPRSPPALPGSTTACIALLKAYVHVNIRDMKEKGTGAKVHAR